MKVKVAATQMSISWDIENNIAKATKMVEDAVKEGANIVLLQELFKTPYFCQKEKYEYLFKRITDDEGNVYERLYTYQVHFVTGCDTEIPMQELSNKTGYVAKSPDEPVMEGYEFIGWHTSDGTEFDFNQVVTESVTLYAKWSGDEGITFLAKDTAFNGNYLYITAGTLVLIAGLVVGVTFVVRSMKNERSKKQ